VVSAKLRYRAPVSLLSAVDLELRPHAKLQLRVQLTLEKAQLVRVLGPSGSGKTTLLRALCRLRHKEGGQLQLDGVSAEQIPAADWRRQVALLPQRPAMFDGTVWQNLLVPFAAKRFAKQPKPSRAEVAELFSSLALEQRLLDADARTLSGGEAARVALARTLLTAPKVLLVDELTANLDAKAAAACVDLIETRMQNGLAVLLVAHQGAPWRPLLSEKNTLDLSAFVQAEQP
jgi:putative ABC transport system ATP-binding protein